MNAPKKAGFEFAGSGECCECCGEGSMTISRVVAEFDGDELTDGSISTTLVCDRCTWSVTERVTLGKLLMGVNVQNEVMNAIPF